MTERQKRLNLIGYAVATLVWLAGLTAVVKLWPSLLDRIVHSHVPVLSRVLLPDHFFLHTLIVFFSIVYLVYIAFVLLGIWAATRWARHVS